MKIVKGILYFILIIVAVLAIAAAFAPSEKIIERSTTINASPAQVFKLVANFENWKEWDPWFRKDTTQERTYNGKLGDEGYHYTWKSDHKQVGNGKMTILSYEDNVRADYHIGFGESGEDMGFDSYFKLEEDGEQTKVTWGMVSKSSWPMKIMHYLTEKFVGPDFDSGLSNLKAAAESMPEENSSMSVEMVTEYGVNYAIVKDQIKWEEMKAFFNDAYGVIFGYIGANGLEPKGNACAFYYTWDTVNQQTNLAAAVPISESIVYETEKTAISIGDADKAESFISYVYTGPYDNLGSVHDALGAWMDKNGKKYSGPVVEEYLVGPASESDPSKYQTRISYHFE